jgi:hypothetical protein
MNDGTAGGRPGGVSHSLAEPPDSAAAGVRHRSKDLTEPQPGHLVLRTGLGVSRRYLVILLLTAVPFAFLELLDEITGGRSGALHPAVILVVGAPIIYLLCRRGLRITSLRLTPDAVQYTGFFGRTQQIPRSQLARIVEVGVRLTVLSKTPLVYDLYLRRDGRCRLRACTLYFDHDDLQLFSQALGVPVELQKWVLRARRMRKEFPHSLPWWMAHLWIVSFAVVIVIPVAYFLVLAAMGR